MYKTIRLCLSKPSEPGHHTGPPSEVYRGALTTVDGRRAQDGDDAGHRFGLVTPVTLPVLRYTGSEKRLTVQVYVPYLYGGEVECWHQQEDHKTPGTVTVHTRRLRLRRSGEDPPLPQPGATRDPGSTTFSTIPAAKYMTNYYHIMEVH